MTIKLPQIGDILISPNNKFIDEVGEPAFDLLECDDSLVTVSNHPILHGLLPSQDAARVEKFTIPYSSRGLGYANGNLHIGVTAGKILTYSLDGTLISSVNISMAGYPQVILWDGNYFWVIGDQSRYYKYNANWTSTGISKTGVQSNAVGGTWDGTYFYLYESDVQRIDKYDSDWIFVGTVISGLSDSVNEINWDGEFFYAGGIQYNSNWVPTGETIPLLYGNGIAVVDGTFWMAGGGVIYAIEGGGVRAPNITALDSRIPYKIVADLTQGGLE